MQKLTKSEVLFLLIGNGFYKNKFPRVIKTSSGEMRGCKDKMHQIVQWFGIPYAEKAQGALRWRKPQPKVPGTEILDCTSPQNRNLQVARGGCVGEEGALNLDIYRPDNKQENLPVLVYFHGGGLQTGKAQEWMGNKICEERNIVFVSVEYRLGAFGSLQLPALKTGDPLEDSGNFSLLDGLAALKWLQKNLAAFGGDPQNVTVSGHSAGGRLCLTMLLSPLFKGLFHKLMTFSSPPVSCKPEDGELVAAHRLAPLAVEDGLQATEEEAIDWLLSHDEAKLAAVRSWLYGLETERVTKLFPPAALRVATFPNLFLDGVVIPKEGYKAKQLNSVPLLLFASTNEFNAFVSVDPYFKKRLKENPADPQTKAEAALAARLGSRLYQYYNSHYICQQLWDNYTAPMYTGNFSYGSTTNVVDQKFMQKFGAAHGIQLPFVSDQYKMPWAKGNDFFSHMGAECLSIIFSGCIYNFMTTGDPNSDEMDVKWKKWTPWRHSEVNFDADREQALINPAVDNFSYQAEFDAFDADTSISEQAKKDIVHKVLNNRWFSEELDKRYGNPSLWYKR